MTEENLITYIDDIFELIDEYDEVKNHFPTFRDFLRFYYKPEPQEVTGDE